MRLRTQLSLAFALVALLTAAAGAFFSHTLIDRQFKTYLANQQDAQALNIVDNLSLQYSGLTDAWNLEAVHTLGMLSLSNGYIIKVYDREGAPVWDAENHDMAQCRLLMADISLRMEEHGTGGDFTAHEFALRQNGQQVGAVSISYFGPFFGSENDFGFIRSLYILLPAVGLASLLLAAAAGFALARRISLPVTESAQIARQIAAGNYGITSAGESSASELRNLVASVNHLAQALARQEKLRRRLTADVAHELRTPLATLSAHLEAMIEGVWEPTAERLAGCHEEILRLGKIVADLEKLERADNDDLNLDRSPADLLALARGVCGNFAGELAQKNLRLEIEGEAVTVPVDRDRIRGALGNLLSNAVKYTPAGGRIRVTVRGTAAAGVLTVEDDGAGIAEDELPFIFERFYRADRSRHRGSGGTGLGLAIVRSVAAAHGGTAEAQNVPGGGACFTVTLPKD
ncbi:MAG: two-component sensor histidine kinase [Gracilibacteraceae bacterium]|jgi:signal transduction histidine kinase|nr:two-component sensor histidine kinase [Gracilibacteraceae bacterium]